jgi:Contact-dependent growth inhibition CdiA C-terminal domain
MPRRGRPSHSHGSPGNMRDAEGAVARTAQDGRIGAERNLVTTSTGQPGGTPDGPPTRIEALDDAETKRSVARENAAAILLADQGWTIKQNPTALEVAQARQATGDVGDPKKNPDYLLEGHVFDCYAPGATKAVRGIWKETEDKFVVRNQTQRVVLDLTDWRGDMAALRRQFADWPIQGIKEVKAITPDGDIVQMDLNRGNA